MTGRGRGIEREVALVEEGKYEQRNSIMLR